MFVRCRSLCLISFIVLFSLSDIGRCQQKQGQGAQLIERKVDDIKEFKKLLRTKNNVLALFVRNENVVGVKRLLGLFADVAEKAYGKASLAFVNCGSEEGKKTCKKLKVNSDPYILKHFYNGEFNKDYDRAESFDSMMRFLLDPTGEMPWEEEPAAHDVLHIPDSQYWMRLLKKEKLPILAMFYAPWCGYCKRLKPEYSQAATALKNSAILAALDVTRVENYDLQQLYNITGFPTLYYFANGEKKFRYAGEYNKEGLIKYMENPTDGSDKAKVVEELSWSEEASDVVHLTDETFKKVIEDNPSVLVMFYAPWCGHCKHMKPDYMAVAKKLKEENSKGILAAVDATKEKKMATEYDVKGFPTVKYFKDGKFAWDFNERSFDGILNFMNDPQEPPPPPPPEVPWPEMESDVLHLTVDTFKSELKKRKHVLVMFYAPWCGHCKKAKPEYMVAASRFKDEPKVAFAAVDCTVHQDICKQYDVQGYPTIKYFSYLKSTADYQSGRDAADFIRYMEQHLAITQSAPAQPPATQPVVEEIKPPAEPEPDYSDPDVWDPAVVQLTPENVDSTLSSYDLTFLFFYSPQCRYCFEAKPEFNAAARLLKDRTNLVLAAIDCVKYEEVCQDKRIVGYPSLNLYNRKGEYIDGHSGKRVRDNLVKTVLDALVKISPPQPPAVKPETTQTKSEL